MEFASARLFARRSTRRAVVVADGATVVQEACAEPVIAIAAIGNPEAFYHSLAALGFTRKNPASRIMQSFRGCLQRAGRIITTKDAMRLNPPDNVLALRTPRDFTGSPRSERKYARWFDYRLCWPRLWRPEAVFEEDAAVFKAGYAEVDITPGVRAALGYVMHRPRTTPPASTTRSSPRPLSRSGRSAPRWSASTWAAPPLSPWSRASSTPRWSGRVSSTSSWSALTPTPRR